MKMIRTFAPIGQGGFSIEKFRNADGQESIYIYDCGSSSGIKQLEKEIDATFEQGREIEAVFITHLHTDHFNGLKYLLKKYKINKMQNCNSKLNYSRNRKA